MIKQIEQQLLLSDLADSTVQHDGLFPEPDGESHVLFESGRVGVLVQVTEVLEIGRPALELLDVHKNRIEDKKVFSEHGIQVRRAVAHVEEATQNVGGDFTQQQAQQEEHAEPTLQKGFPRSMLRLKVSDGFTEYAAIECKRVPDLSLEDTPLGCKVRTNSNAIRPQAHLLIQLFLKNIRCLRGVLMLDGQSCSVKGGRIAELDDNRDEMLKFLLERRIRCVQVRGLAIRLTAALCRGENAPDAAAAEVLQAPARRPAVRRGHERRVPPPRAPLPKSPRHKQEADKRDAKREDYDALLDDDDDMNDDDASALPQDTKVVRNARTSAANREPSKQADIKGKAKVVKDESFQFDDDEELWESAAAASSAPVRQTKRQDESQHGRLPKPRAPAPAHHTAVIDLMDDSSSDAEVKAQLVAPKRSRLTARKGGGGTVPIEID